MATSLKDLSSRCFFLDFLPLLVFSGVACGLLDSEAYSSENPPWSELMLVGSSSWLAIFEISPMEAWGGMISIKIGVRSGFECKGTSPDLLGSSALDLSSLLLPALVSSEVADWLVAWA